jgi:transposase
MGTAFFRGCGGCLKGWLSRARESGIAGILTLPRAIVRRPEGIMNLYIHPNSTGPIEGLNARIKHLLRRAYGYMNIDTFKLFVHVIREFNPCRIIAENPVWT